MTPAPKRARHDEQSSADGEPGARGGEAALREAEHEGGERGAAHADERGRGESHWRAAAPSVAGTAPGTNRGLPAGTKAAKTAGER